MRFVSAGEAGELLRVGGVGLVPTETVVGLVAGERGLYRLFEIKERDPASSVALICPSTGAALGLAREAPPLAHRLAARFWPGPLTLVLDAAGGGTVGVRVPEHPVARELLAAHGSPLYATSANISGEPAAAALEEVDPHVREAVDFAVKGRPGAGQASAVVDLSGGKVRLLRPGAGLTEEALSKLAARVV